MLLCIKCYIRYFATIATIFNVPLQYCLNVSVHFRNKIMVVSTFSLKWKADTFIHLHDIGPK